jgi:hypothetical protein
VRTGPEIVLQQTTIPHRQADHQVRNPPPPRTAIGEQRAGVIAQRVFEATSYLDGCGGDGAANCLRQCGQPAAGSWRLASEGNCRSPVCGRLTSSPDPATADGKPAAGGLERTHGIDAGLLEFGFAGSLRGRGTRTHPIALTVTPDLRVLSFTRTGSMLTGALCGLPKTGIPTLPLAVMAACSLRAAGAQ